MTSGLCTYVLLCCCCLVARLDANWLSIASLGASLDQSQLDPYEPVPDVPSSNGYHQPQQHQQQQQQQPVYARRTISRQSIQYLCNSTNFQLNAYQAEMCARQPYAMPSVSSGARHGIGECQYQFQFERWNCTNIQSNQSDLLGPTRRAFNRESAFISAVSAAGIVHQITRGCSSGNLTECGCDNKIRGVRSTTVPIVRHTHPHPPTSVAAVQQQQQPETWTWGGCSENVNYGLQFAEDFLDQYELEQFEASHNVTHQVNMHNHLVGRMLVYRLMHRQCRCHGVSGSCEFKTCWMQLPDFGDVGATLKTRYDMLAVRVAKRAKRRLRRKKQSDRRVAITDSELVFVNKSPDYCERNETTGVFGTRDRQCNAGSVGRDSCDLLCCGRGYNTRIVTRTDKCNCKFVWCCYVKCKICHSQVELHTCK